MNNSLLIRTLRNALSTPRFIATIILLSLVTVSGCHRSSGSSHPLSLQITPTNPSVAANTSVQLTATAIYSDNRHADVTSRVSWATSNIAVATVGASDGKASGVATGTATISANLQGVTTTTTITVTRPSVMSIAVTPPVPSIAAGTSEQFIATGTFPDGTTQNLTTDITWTSSNTAVATVSNSGLASAIGPGKATISATCTVASTCSALAGNATLTVTPAMLVSIAITPTGPSVSAADTEQFTATGTYSDNSTRILTAIVTWASSNASIASISNSSGSQGLATGLIVGSTSISASLDGVSSPTVKLIVTDRVAAGLHSFTGTPDGGNPAAGLIQGTDGNFYGTTSAGGTSDHGTVFKITPTGAETVLYSFTGGTDGGVPLGGVIQGTDGNFYGTTSAGGTSGSGTVFKVTPTGAETVLYSFAGGTDGKVPLAGLIQGTDGNFYGTTQQGGASDGGTVFEVTSAGSETVLYMFTYGDDGGYPEAALIQGTDGNFYGTTAGAGTSGYGTVFKVTPAGVETVLYSFTGGSDGGASYGALVQGTDGNFYGMTELGGADNVGTVIKVTPAGIETVLHSFTNGSDGGYPTTALIQATDGNFYGTTYQGGTSDFGTIFRITPAGIETMYSFTAGDDGASPKAGLIQGTDGRFYGTTAFGGTDNDGTIFKF